MGAIADQAARSLAHEKHALMCCTAAIGAGITDIAEKARGASKLVALDGCDKECSRKILEANGFGGFAHIRLDKLGMEKGKSPMTEERVALTLETCMKRLAE